MECLWKPLRIHGFDQVFCFTFILYYTYTYYNTYVLHIFFNFQNFIIHFGALSISLYVDMLTCIRPCCHSKISDGVVKQQECNSHSSEASSSRSRCWWIWFPGKDMPPGLQSLPSGCILTWQVERKRAREREWVLLLIPSSRFYPQYLL